MSFTTVRLTDTIISAFVGGILLLILFSKRLRKNKLWTVTVTPLASIIGSGFLIVAPVMWEYFRSFSLPLIILLNILAFLIGAAIRYNIKYFDPHERKFDKKGFLFPLLELSSNFILGVSYIIAIAFYASILSSFFFKIFGLEASDYIGFVKVDLLIKSLTTIILGFVATWGYYKGLHALESLEKVAVNIKMAVIGMLLTALLIYLGFSLNGATPTSYEFIKTHIGLHELTILGGLLLITQGFETVKYLGDDYSVTLRIKAMKLAQILAAVIYTIFVSLAGPISGVLEHVTETAIIDTLSFTAFGLGFVLSVAAIFSQFGAVVADTIGSGGLLEETTNRRINEKQAYMLSGFSAILLSWFFPIFKIVTLASRFFALYYFLQILLAGFVALKRKDYLKSLEFFMLSMVVFGVVAFAKSVH